MTFEATVWARIKGGVIANEAKGREKEWVAERIRNFRHPSGPVDNQYGDTWIRVKTVKLRDGGSMVLTSDITAGKQAEQALLRRAEHYRDAIENAPYAFIVTRLNGVIEFANQAAVEMFRAESANQFIGQDQLILLHPDYHEEVLSRREQIFKGHPKQISERGRIRFEGTQFVGESCGSICSWNWSYTKVNNAFGRFSRAAPSATS